MIVDNTQSEQVRLWNLPSFDEVPGLLHFVSGRMGGVSSPPLDSLNLSFRVQDRPRNVVRNRELLAWRVGRDLSSFVTCQQVHGGSVRVVSAEMAGCGARDYESALPSTDAMVTDVQGIMLMVLQADCVPVFLHDSRAGAVGIAHAGWRGAIDGVAANAVGVMVNAFGCRPAEIQAGIGPSIGPCCYEIGPEVIKRAKEAFLDSSAVLLPSQGEHAYFDLWQANRMQLLKAGLPETNVTLSGLCTKCSSDDFFSERGQRPTGRFGAAIGLA